MASGSPSSARQIRATLLVRVASITKPRFDAAAHCRNSCTAALSVTSWALSLLGSPSGSTSNTCSPRIRSGVRLDTSTRSLGAAASSSAARTAAPSRCSKLSSTNSNSRPRR